MGLCAVGAAFEIAVLPREIWLLPTTACCVQLSARCAADSPGGLGWVVRPGDRGCFSRCRWCPTSSRARVRALPDTKSRGARCRRGRRQLDSGYRPGGESVPTGDRRRDVVIVGRRLRWAEMCCVPVRVAVWRPQWEPLAKIGRGCAVWCRFSDSWPVQGARGGGGIRCSWLPATRYLLLAAWTPGRTCSSRAAFQSRSGKKTGFGRFSRPNGAGAHR